MYHVLHIFLPGSKLMSAYRPFLSVFWIYAMQNALPASACTSVYSDVCSLQTSNRLELWRGSTGDRCWCNFILLALRLVTSTTDSIATVPMGSISAFAFAFFCLTSHFLWARAQNRMMHTSPPSVQHLFLPHMPRLIPTMSTASNHFQAKLTTLSSNDMKIIFMTPQRWATTLSSSRCHSCPAKYHWNVSTTFI